MKKYIIFGGDLNQTLVPNYYFALIACICIIY